MLNSKLFASNMRVMEEVYGKSVSKELLKIYYSVLKDMTDEQFKQAVHIVISTHVWASFPKPAEFLQAIQDDPDAQAILALDKLEEAMRTVGAYESVKFDDPTLMVLVERQEGGWPGLCAITLEEWRFKRPQLIKAYKAYHEGRLVPNGEHLTGLVEMNNQGVYPNHMPKPVEIGDTVKPLEIEHNKLRKGLDI